MTCAMKTDNRIYNRIEFTLDSEDPRFADFGKDLLGFVEKYGDSLIGYQAEEVGGDDINVLCEDADAAQAKVYIREVFGIE